MKKEEHYMYQKSILLPFQEDRGYFDNYVGLLNFQNHFINYY